MLATAKRCLQNWARRKEQIIPFGFNWLFIVSVDATMVIIGGIAAAQRPLSDLPVALVAMAIAFTPWLLYFVLNINSFEGTAIGAAWMGATAILLFATTGPIEGDFAPLLISLTVGVVTAITSLRGGAIATAAATVILLLASTLHRLDTVALYLAFVGIGWLIGHLLRLQQQLMIEQRATQAQLAALAVADERRRIAREVHDVIAHSLSVTMLHLTAARHALEHDSGDDDAVVALQQAERLGRQAMTDIRQTVGLLDADPASRAPEPSITDIPSLTADFTRAGLDVTLKSTGDLSRVSATAGLALYRVAQESLANIAKHAPNSPSSITVAVTCTQAALVVTNRWRGAAISPGCGSGRGLSGMRQRVELLGGTIDFGPNGEGWQVSATIPVDPSDGALPVETLVS